MEGKTKRKFGDENLTRPRVVQFSGISFSWLWLTSIASYWWYTGQPKCYTFDCSSKSLTESSSVSPSCNLCAFYVPPVNLLRIFCVKCHHGRFCSWYCAMILLMALKFVETYGTDAGFYLHGRVSIFTNTWASLYVMVVQILACFVYWLASLIVQWPVSEMRMKIATLSLLV